MKYLKTQSIFITGLFIAGMLSMNSFGETNAAKAQNKAVSKTQEAKKVPQLTKKTGIQATFVELGSVNCVPCKMMQPVMKDIEKEYGDRVKIVFYDVWTNEGKPFGDKYKIRAIPTQIFLDKDGKEFFRHTGFFPLEEIVKVFDKQGVKKLTAAGNKSSDNGKSNINMKDGVVCE